MIRAHVIRARVVPLSDQTETGTLYLWIPADVARQLQRGETFELYLQPSSSSPLSRNRVAADAVRSRALVDEREGGDSSSPTPWITSAGGSPPGSAVNACPAEREVGASSPSPSVAVGTSSSEEDDEDGRWDIGQRKAFRDSLGNLKLSYAPACDAIEAKYKLRPSQMEPGPRLDATLWLEEDEGRHRYAAAVRARDQLVQELRALDKAVRAVAAAKAGVTGKKPSKLSARLLREVLEHARQLGGEEVTA